MAGGGALVFPTWLGDWHRFRPKGASCRGRASRAAALERDGNTDTGTQRASRAVRDPGALHASHREAAWGGGGAQLGRRRPALALLSLRLAE